MDSAAIHVDDLHKAYGGQPVRRGLSFTVGVGEIFGIAGRNGAGKTTVIEILQGLRRRDAGRVDVLGLDPARKRTRLRPLVGAQLQTFASGDGDSDHRREHDCEDDGDRGVAAGAIAKHAEDQRWSAARRPCSRATWTSKWS